jgi:hypothetical protein
VEVAIISTILLLTAVDSAPTFIAVAAVVFESDPCERVFRNVASSVARTVVDTYFRKFVLAPFPGVATITVALEVETVSMKGAIVGAFHFQALFSHIRIFALAHWVTKGITITYPVTVAIRRVTFADSTVGARPACVASTLALNTSPVVAGIFTDNRFAAVRTAVTFITIAPLGSTVVG